MIIMEIYFKSERKYEDWEEMLSLSSLDFISWWELECCSYDLKGFHYWKATGCPYWASQSLGWVLGMSSGKNGWLSCYGGLILGLHHIMRHETELRGAVWILMTEERGGNRIQYGNYNYKMYLRNKSYAK